MGRPTSRNLVAILVRRVAILMFNSMPTSTTRFGSGFEEAMFGVSLLIPMLFYDYATLDGAHESSQTPALSYNFSRLQIPSDVIMSLIITTELSENEHVFINTMFEPS
jgi:hypothetical protein